jgi:hypothetical protein
MSEDPRKQNLWKSGSVTDMGPSHNQSGLPRWPSAVALLEDRRRRTGSAPSGRTLKRKLLVPQMNLEDKTARDWPPGFLDYIFLAFNTSKVFSPTDIAILSWQVKILMMGQALLSLKVLVVLVSWAINTLAAT